MAENGGRFENYYSREVTHIVCCNLPDSKVKHFAHERSPPPTVRPEWVVDSLAAGRLLPVRRAAALWPLSPAPACQRLAPAAPRLAGAWRPALCALAVVLLLHATPGLLKPCVARAGQGAAGRPCGALTRRRRARAAGDRVCAVAAAGRARAAHAGRLCGAATVPIGARAPRCARALARLGRQAHQRPPGRARRRPPQQLPQPCARPGPWRASAAWATRRRRSGAHRAPGDRGGVQARRRGTSGRRSARADERAAPGGAWAGGAGGAAGAPCAAACSGQRQRRRRGSRASGAARGRAGSTARRARRHAC